VEAMISKDELTEAKVLRKTTLYYAEKEYLQYIFLNAISEYPDEFTFKGGTCLRIAFELERASEDMDFCTTVPINRVKGIVRSCLRRFELLGIDHTIYSEKMFEGNYRSEIRFQGPLYTGDKRTSNTIKIDFNKRKALHKEPQLIKKLFSDVPPFTLVVMGKQEVLAEKLRALCMRAEPRDLYDVWALISLGESIDKKMLHNKLKEDNVKSFELRLPSKKMYDDKLRLLLKNVPDYDKVVRYVKSHIEKL
jgi:predicted nucleotidyltransferase component of viral defense system